MSRPAYSQPDEFSQLRGRPELALGDARGLLTAWGLSTDTVAVEELGSERDQNFRVSVGGHARYVLKVANSQDDASIVGFQHAMMQRLVSRGLPCPAVIPTTEGAPWVVRNGHLVWLMRHLPGHRLADHTDHSGQVFEQLGHILGRVVNALDGFDHPAAHRRLQWDALQTGAVLEVYRVAVTDSTKRDILDRAAYDVQRHLEPILTDLPRSVIHNDANDHNVLVDGEKITGLLDFGDAVHSVTVNELAVGCAYAMLDKPDPEGVAQSITNGYGAERRITTMEERALPYLIRARLATSVAISAYQQTVHPDNKYLRVSERPAWHLLARLQESS
ncbi:MAG TPA: phosphotransferase [Mycobacteriales bacterium]|nr:phosphotransferase [Mycobacteriales bacterium]